MATSNQLNGSGPAPLSSSRLSIQKTKTLREIGWLADPPEGLFSSCTDHMMVVRWTLEQGWADPEIVPYGNLSIPPTASCLHYATQCYEGTKVYRGYDGGLRLFRPNLNCKRMIRSAQQVSLPTFDPVELERLIIALLAIDCGRWLPSDTCRGKSLYVRPAMIANGSTIGVRLPAEALLFVIVVPWSEIDSDLVENGLQLITSPPESIRAWPGGFGSTKIGANYGPSFVSLGEARAAGYDQVLWLFGEEGIVTEAGASNIFVVWVTKEGVLQLLTPALDDKVILPGITRDSVLDLARRRLGNESNYNHAKKALHILESRFCMSDIAKASEEGRLVEAFVSGTAVSLPIR